MQENGRTNPITLSAFPGSSIQKNLCLIVGFGQINVFENLLIGRVVNDGSQLPWSLSGLNRLGYGHQGVNDGCLMVAGGQQQDGGRHTALSGTPRKTDADIGSRGIHGTIVQGNQVIFGSSECRASLVQGSTRGGDQFGNGRGSHKGDGLNGGRRHEWSDGIFGSLNHLKDAIGYPGLL